MSDNKRYGKDILMQMIARVCSGLLSFVAVIVLTYCFSEQDIGRYNLMLSAVNIATSVTTLWLSQSILRFYEQEENDSFILFASLVAVLFSLGFVFVFSFFFEITIWAFVYCFVLVIYNILDAIFRKTRSLGKYVALEIVFSFGRLFPMVLVAYYTKRFDAVFISQSILLLLFILCTLIFNRKQRIKLGKINYSLFGKYMRYGLPLVGLSVSSWLLTSAAQYVISFYENETSVGIYSTVASLSHSIYSMFTLVIVSAFQPIIVNQWNKDEHEVVPLISKTVDYNIMLVVPLVFYGCLKSPDLLSVFKGDVYAEYYSIFIWTAIGSAVSGISLLYHKYYELRQNTKWILIFNFISAVINIILNIILVPIFGFEIAAFVTFISSCVYFLIVRIATFKVFPVKFSFKVAFVVFVSCVVFYFLDRMIVRDNSFWIFLLEGCIYVLYTSLIYVITGLVNIKSIVCKK